MGKAMKLNVAILFLVLLFSGCFFVQKNDPPRDEKILKAYFNHRAEFQELAAFCERYPGVSRIAPGFTYPADLRDVGVSQEELARVRFLMRQAGCGAGLGRTFGAGGSMFLYFAEGLPSGGVEKGLAYMDVLPESTEASLDGYGWHTVAHKRAFRAIEGRWFVYFERD